MKRPRAISITVGETSYNRENGERSLESLINEAVLITVGGYRALPRDRRLFLIGAIRSAAEAVIRDGEIRRPQIMAQIGLNESVNRRNVAKAIEHAKARAAKFAAVRAEIHEQREAA